MKKMLYVTSLSGKRIGGFMRSAILASHEAGIDFTMACNMEMADAEGYKEDCATYGIRAIHIDFDRNPFSLKNVSAYRQLLELMRKEQFDIVHCNTPIGGVLGRLCARKAKIPHVIYQAHGFHFFKGAPIKNWVLFYPVERLCAHWTDVLITINKEDYERAKKFKARKVCYVPGVGIDTSKFSLMKGIRAEKRKELGLDEAGFLLLSVGELIPRKNHGLVIKALASLKNEQGFENCHYLICGQGVLENQLKDMAEEQGVADKVHLLGYRDDITELCSCCDLFVFMSLQEGLPVALMEAMACGIPIICSNVRGNTDLIQDDVSGRIVENDFLLLAGAIREMKEDAPKRQRYAWEAQKRIKRFDLRNAQNQLKDIYTKELEKTGGGGLTLQMLDATYKRQEMRRGLNIPLDAYVLLSVGELNRNKNHRVVIEALARLERSDVFYVLCGCGPLEDEYKRLSRELGISERVVFAGYRDNIADFYHMADLFVFPSFREGLSAALMEAMASGLPCIVSKIRGNVDLIIDSQQWFAPNDKKKLEDLIRGFIDRNAIVDTRGELENIEKYSIDNVVKLMQEVYDELK